MGSDPMGVQFIVSMGLIFLVMYFLILRPQQKRQKEREAMLKNVKKGDRIVTTGGVHGTVVSTKGDGVLVVRIAENVRVDVERSAVSAISGTDAAE